MNGIATCSTTQHMCNCRGPQNGEPACPCAMAQQRLAEARFYTQDRVPNAYAPSPEDYAWARDNLGDVPYDRIVGLTCHDNPIGWVSTTLQVQDRPWLPWRDVVSIVPVESLGRDSDG